MKPWLIIIIGSLLAFTACKSRPYIRSESTTIFSVASSGSFPAEKIALENLRLREKIQIITQDKRSDCFISADDFGYTLVTITKKRLSEEQAKEISKYAAKARDNAWQK